MALAWIDLLNVLGKELDGPELQTLVKSIGFAPEIQLNEHFTGFRMDHFRPAGVSILSNYGKISQVNLFAQRYPSNLRHTPANCHAGSQCRTQ